MSREKLGGASQTLTVLSKAHGWMTVTPQTMDKKNPMEKHLCFYEKSDLQTDLSRLAPVWMQEQSPFTIKDGAPQLI